jgi:hypothetical protein
MQEQYHIRVKGHLSQQWNDWFDGFNITNLENGEALLSGSVADQAALHGILIKVRDLGLPLIALCRVGPREEDRPEDAPSCTGLPSREQNR